MKKQNYKKKPSSTPKKKSAQKEKNPLGGKSKRIHGNDKGKIIIWPDFDKPLDEFRNE